MLSAAGSLWAVRAAWKLEAAATWPFSMTGGTLCSWLTIHETHHPWGQQTEGSQQVQEGGGCRQR